MTVSVVIPTFYAKDLSATLAALQAQTIWPRIVEILVIGQQALTGWESLPKVSYLPVLDRPTPARNRNIGAGAARGEWILFTDSDCVPNATWAASLLAAADKERVDAVCGSVVVGPAVGYWGLCDHLLVFAETTPDSPERDVTQAATLNFGIRKFLFTALGDFDVAFPAAAGEDQDFSLRLIAAGHRIFFAPTAIVEHRHARHQFADAWRHIYGYGEAVTVRHNLRGMDQRWRFALRLLRFPVLLEFAGLGRVLLRLWSHFRYLALLRPPALHALPGVLVLDFALSYGMICSLRTLGVPPAQHPSRENSEMTDHILPSDLLNLPRQTKIGVVIVNWNGCQVTQETLADLRRIHLPGLDMMQLYLVDNGSTDNSVSYFRSDPSLELIELDHNTGFSAGANAGICKALTAGCEYILLLNNDVYLTSDFLALLVDWLASTPGAGIATPKIRYADPEQVIWYGGGLFRWPRLLGGMIGLDEVDRGQYNEPQIVDFATGCCMLVKREVFENIGLLDENFPFYQEDVDFCVRAANAGFEIWYRPEAMIWHRVSHSTANDQPRRTYLYAQSRFIFFGKHIHGLRWVPVLGMELIRLLRTVGTATLRGQFLQAWSYTSGLFSGVRTLFR